MYSTRNHSKISSLAWALNSVPVALGRSVYPDWLAMQFVPCGVIHQRPWSHRVKIWGLIDIAICPDVKTGDIMHPFRSHGVLWQIYLNHHVFCSSACPNCHSVERLCISYVHLHPRDYSSDEPIAVVVITAVGYDYGKLCVVSDTVYKFLLHQQSLRSRKRYGIYRQYPWRLPHR